MAGHSCKNQPNQAISFVGSGYCGEMWILMAQIFGRNFIKKMKLYMKLCTLQLQCISFAKIQHMRMRYVYKCAVLGLKTYVASDNTHTNTHKRIAKKRQKQNEKWWKKQQHWMHLVIKPTSSALV